MIGSWARNRQQIPRDERRSQLLEKGKEFFVAQGYRGTSVAEVGRACGITGYFPSKDDLFGAVLAGVFSESRAVAEAAAGEGAAQLKLEKYLTTAMPFRSLSREAYERMEDSDAVRSVYAAELAWLESVFLEAISDRLDGEAVDGVTIDTARLLFEGMLVSVRRLDRPVGQIIERMIDVLAKAARSPCADAAEAI